MKVFNSYVFLLLLLLTGSASALSAQNRAISGRVLDALQEPLIGLTVGIEGSSRGSVTDINGVFELQIPISGATLNFSYVGYITEKVKVKPGQNDIVVYMQEDAIMLDEAVVIGYGTQKKVNLTGAVTMVDNKSLENRVSHSLTNMLQGSVPGLNITTSSGVPGSSPSINVRGTTSINSAEPLVLIDGAVGELERINPNDVESISVIKDASAAAVYGARAAFGVILVTTKSGAANEGKATVRYSGRLGWESPTTSTDYEDTGYWSVYTVNLFRKAENGKNYINYTDEDMRQLLARVNDKTENPDRPWVVEEMRNGRRQWVYYGNYDWWEMMFDDTHPTQQHNISISGGNKDVKYMVSGAYDYQKGILRMNPDIYRKYNLRSKLDFRINKWATMTNNTSFYGSQYTSQGDGSVENTLAYSSNHALACFPMKNPDGSWLYGTPYIDNMKMRASFGSLGNQNVSSYYTYMRLVTVSSFAGYSFGEGSSMAKYSTLGAPVSSDLTWETSQQWDLGFDFTMLKNRLNITVDGYVRNTLNMLTDGIELPAVYGASMPDMNTANLQTRGYEIAVSWRDQFELAGRPVEYTLGANMSDYKSYITKYDNKDKTFAKDYYEGMRLGEIWGFVTDGLFETTEEAQAYAKEVDLSYINNRITGGWQGGDLKFVDLNDNKKLDIGSNSVDDPGDRKILGNSLPSLSYGFNASLRWYGFDVSVFFQGTGNHYWYPDSHAAQFWGAYTYPYLTYLQKNFMDEVWTEDNKDAYFTRPMAYSATSGPLSKVNDRYLQNIRYLRFKNLTVGYTIPVNLTKKIGVEQARIYFSGENLCYWSPLKKHTKYIDPESAFDRSNDTYNRMYYPWQKTFMFGVDITF